MEQEIDIGKYLRALIRRWRLVLLTPLVLTIAALFVFMFLRPAPFEAVSSVAIVKWQEDVTLDPKFRTISEQELAGPSFYLKAETRRNALASLVTSGVVAERVIARLGESLPLADRVPGRLLAKVTGELAKSSDLLVIQVRHSDPQVAAAIATAWATEYETYVNDIYGANPALSAAVDAELDHTQHTYQQKQQDLELFIADNQIDQLTRQISMTEQIVRDLQEETRQTLSTVIEQRLKLNTNLIAQYLNTQSSVASSVISQEVGLRTAVLADHYATRIELERLIGTARTFRAQVAAGGDASSRSSELALILLKAQIFTDRKALPGSVQLTLGQEGRQRSQAEYLADLDALIKVLEQRRVEVAAQSERAAQDLLSGQILPANLQHNDNPLQQAAAKYLTRLLNLDGLEEMIPETDKSALVAKIDEQDSKLAAMRSALEREKARERQLTQQRNLAWETYTTIARKQAEVGIASRVQGSEVRLAAPAIVSDRRAYSASLSVLTTCLLGILLGILLALTADVAAGFQSRAGLWGGLNAPWNRAFRWMLNEPMRLSEDYSGQSPRGERESVASAES